MSCVKLENEQDLLLGSILDSPAAFGACLELKRGLTGTAVLISGPAQGRRGWEWSRSFSQVSEYRVTRQ